MEKLTGRSSSYLCKLLTQRKIIDGYHSKAQQNGSLIVSACGLDSLVADMLTFLIAENMKEVHKQDVKEVAVYTDELNLS